MERTVYRINKAGSIKRLHKQNEHLDGPQDNEVQVKVKSIGLNFADIFALSGLYSATPPASFIPGLEFSGEVLQTGNRVKELKTGDRVMGLTRFGAYATYLNCDERYLFLLDENRTYEEGAGFLVNTLTAYYGLVTLGGMSPGMQVLIHSAAGGVGLMGNRIAQRIGAKTIGTVGTAGKINQLKDEDFTDILLRDKAFSNRLKKYYGKIDLAFDGIGGKIFEYTYDALAPQGRIVVMGAAQYTPKRFRPDYLRTLFLYLNRPRIDPLQMISDNKSVMGFNLIWLWSHVDELQTLYKRIDALQLDPPRISERFKFEDLPLAIRRLQSGKTIGKVVILVE